MATHSSVLAWRIPGTGEPSGLPSMGSYRVRHYWSDLAAAAAAVWCIAVGDGQGGLACCDSWGRKESDTTERLNWTELDWAAVWTHHSPPPKFSTYVLPHFSHVWLFATSWAVAFQAAPSIGFSRQEYWSGLPRPPSGDVSEPGIKPTSFISPALAAGFFTTGTTWNLQYLAHKRMKNWRKTNRR